MNVSLKSIAKRYKAIKCPECGGHAKLRKVIRGLIGENEGNVGTYICSQKHETEKVIERINGRFNFMLDRFSRKCLS